jgi:uncharacterized membrane protein
MTITNNKITIASLLSIGVLLCNLLVLGNYQYLLVFFSTLILFFLPGILFLGCLRSYNISFIKLLVYSLGISLSFIMLIGFLANELLPLFGIDQPLSTQPILITYVFSLLPFLVTNFVRNKRINLKLNLRKFNPKNIFLYSIPVALPIISIVGENLLNNNASGFVSLFLLFIIGAALIPLTIFRKSLHDSFYLWLIFFESVALTFMYSMRSAHILGFDINYEYEIFQLTKTTYYWNIQKFTDPYYACLSITILPTVLSSILHIKDELIFKIIFQLIFGFVPLTIYLIARKFLIPLQAFLVSFVFISQPWFIEQMPALTRQEIGLFFFSLILLCFFDKDNNKVIRNTLLSIFGISLIVSHYSTTYIWLFITISAYISFQIGKLFFKSLRNSNLNINGYYLIFMLLITFLWNSQLTHTSGNIQVFVYRTMSNIYKTFTIDTLENASQQFLFSSNTNNNNKIIQDYYKKISPFDAAQDSNIYYPKTTYSSYIPIFKSEEDPKEIYKPTLFTNTIVNISKIIKIFYVDIFTLVGILYLVFSRKKYRIDKGFIFLSCSTLLPIIAILLLPTFQAEYNLTRLFMQGLILLSFSTIIGAIFIMNRFGKYMYLVLITSLIIFFYYSSAFTTQIIGDLTTIYLNHPGGNYDSSFIYDTEISSSHWLQNNRNPNIAVYADVFAKLRLNSYGNIKNINTNLFPSIMYKNSYVYLTENNYLRRIDYFFINNVEYTFNYPNDFLQKNKNLIYSNGNSVIYK